MSTQVKPDNNIVSFSAFKRKKNLEKPVLSPNMNVQTHLSTHSESTPINGAVTPDMVRARMDRIRHTIQKINSVVEELKTMSNKELN